MRSVFVMVGIVVAMIGCGTSEEPRFEGASATAEGHAGHPEGHHEGTAHHEEPAQHAGGGHACEGEGCGHAPTAGAPAPTRTLEDGARLYGAEMQGERATTELAQIVASPSTFDGQVVRTSGTIERVCQRMGCWMELRGTDTPAVRVPMAGHAFFLPRDVAGRTATIEGTVAVEELSAAAREHLASEGAVATASSLSIDATSVVVR